MPTVNHTAAAANETVGEDILGIDAKTLSELTVSVTGAAASWQINSTPVTDQHLLNTTATTEFYSFTRAWLDAHRGELDYLTFNGTTSTTKYAISYAQLPNSS